MELWVLLLCLGAAVTSRVDVDTATVFRGDPRGAFGQNVAQVGTSDDGWVLVGAPLQHGGVNQRGRIYSCGFRSGTCQEVPVMGPPDAVNSSLGLALAAGDTGALACGPTVPKPCGQNVHLTGFCVLLDSNLQQLQRVPDVLPECPKSSSDIVFLIDGSGSIRRQDFQKMKDFIVEVMKQFKDTDTKFALTQFSDAILNHFNFQVHDPIRRVLQVRQLGGFTYTATAIKKVLTELFTPGQGAREGVNKILIIITDGKKYKDPLEYSDVIPLASSRGVIRYAIGVGSAFRDPEAMAELQAVASQPSQDHVFRVDNFDALQGIQNQLQEKIFAIEGTQSAQSSSFQLEMAQEGFSALLTPEGPVLGAVGAYGWAGGVFVYGSPGEAPTFLNVSRGSGDMSDAYLGYAAEALSLGGQQGLALGAPRYGHLGRLLLFQRRGPGAAWELLAEAAGPQVGSYFGASLCALDGAAALLVGAPMFYGASGGGRVAVCSLRAQGGRLPCQEMLQGQPGHPLGRFGASLARLGDLDGDRWPEVAVGAPLEDEERGAVYIFRGVRGGVAPQYSQRISGARFPSGPRHLGQALSGGRDLTGDRLPDLAVGAQGQVLLLRSPPLVKLRVTVTFQPPELPAAAFACREDQEAPGGVVATAQICFSLTKKTNDSFGSRVSLTLRPRLLLDPGRAKGRAIAAGGAHPSRTRRLGLGRSCEAVAMAWAGCPRDTLTPLGLRLELGASGDPLEEAGGLRVQLSQDSQTVATGTLPFEKNCGDDNVCLDDLRVSFSFSGLDTLVVGETDAVDVTVTLRNRGEDSYGATVRLLHPQALSYRKALVLQSPRRSVSLRCNSEPAEGPRRRTLCMVDHPIFPRGAQAVFTVTLDVPPEAELGAALEVLANASSDNGTPGGQEQRQELPVRYGVFLGLTSTSNSTKYINVSSRGGDPDSAPVTHHYELKILGQRGPPSNVTFWVPTALGGTPLWDRLEVTPLQELVRCWVGSDLPGVPDPPRLLKDPLVLECPGAACRELHCGVPQLEPPRTLGVLLGGRLALGWMRTLQQPKVVVRSRARVLYDEGRYRNRGGGERLQVETLLERLEPPNLLPLILGGTVGGLVLLALAALGLYKVGFFKRRYKNLMEGDETPMAPPGDPQQ